MALRRQDLKAIVKAQAAAEAQHSRDVEKKEVIENRMRQLEQEITRLRSSEAP